MGLKDRAAIEQYKNNMLKPNTQEWMLANDVLRNTVSLSGSENCLCHH